MDVTWEQVMKENSITEETRVKVRVGTAWVVLSTIVATTVWLTGVMLKVEATNAQEHVKLLSGITTLNDRSDDWVTTQQLEDTLAFIITEAHRGMTNVNIREADLREGVRNRLHSPKTSP